MTEFAFQLTNVAKRYPEFALSGLNLSLDTGQIMGFIGANGAGKSTTIRMLMGLVRPDQGSVRVLGVDVPAQQVQAKRDIGYVSDDMRLYPSATLQWHMDFVRSIYPSWDPTYAMHLARRFEVTAEQKIRGMSHGQRVKSALLLALARRPRLLVLDEPTTGLDPVARLEVIDALMEVIGDDQRSVFFSSHNTLDVEQVSDQIAFIDRGRLLDCDDKESFLERWQRVRIELGEGQTLRLPADSVLQGGSARFPVLICHNYNANTLADLRADGATVLAVEAMRLEEIFIASVQQNRVEHVS
jgi:ABC-2 type transport system ATP-binding protein